MPAPVAGVDGAWACLHCSNVNFAVRTACNRCQRPKEEELQQYSELQYQQPSQPQHGGFQKGPVAGVDGNWACPICRNVNFPGRTECNRCKTPKPEDSPQVPPPFQGSRPQHGGPPVAGVDGNWECLKCKNVNYGMREACNRCQEPKPLDGELSDADPFAQMSELADLGAPPPPADLGAPPPKRKPAGSIMSDSELFAHLSEPAEVNDAAPKRGPQPGVDGNWSCPQCQNVNFGMRTVCNRCQTPKPADPPAQGRSMTADDFAGFLSPAPTQVSAPKGKGRPQAGVDGNWECPYCKNVNFAVRTECNLCHAPKPEESPQAARAPQGPPVAGVGGNWECLKCKNVNLHFREACNRCQEPKPQRSPQTEEDYFQLLLQSEPEDAGATLQPEPEDVSATQAGTYHARAPKRGGPQPGVDGNWECPQCQNVNYAARNVCNRCQAPKPDESSHWEPQAQTYAGPQGAGPQGAGPQGAGPQSAGPKGVSAAGAAGNWSCLKCKNVNLYWREACNRCQEPKAAESIMNGATHFNDNWQPAQEHVSPPKGGGRGDHWQPAQEHVSPPKGGGRGPQPGVDGNWSCPQCNNVNFAAREACNRCQAPKPAETWPEPWPAHPEPPRGPPEPARGPPEPARGPPEPPRGPPVAGVDGNWACPKCQNVNFPIRTACNRCQEPKPSDQMTEVDFATSGYFSPAPSDVSAPKRGPQAGVDGNWACPQCQNVNFAIRTTCNLCHTPKPVETSQAQPTFTPQGAPVAGVGGNWSCPSCRNVNLPFREACNRCQAPRPQDLPKRASGAPQSGVDGNWSCPQCQNVNFPARTVCNRCQAPKPAATPQAYVQPARSSHGGPVAGVDGNWECSKCRNVNYRMREVCNRCGEAKPTDLLTDEELFAQLSQPAPGFDDPPTKRPRHY